MKLSTSFNYCCMNKAAFMTWGDYVFFAGTLYMFTGHICN